MIILTRTFCSMGFLALFHIPGIFSWQKPQSKIRCGDTNRKVALFNLKAEKSFSAFLAYLQSSWDWQTKASDVELTFKVKKPSLASVLDVMWSEAAHAWKRLEFSSILSHQWATSHQNHHHLPETLNANYKQGSPASTNRISTINSCLLRKQLKSYA